MPTKPKALDVIAKYRKKRLAEESAVSDTSSNLTGAVMHTGNGPNGIPEPEKPIGVISTGNGPAMVHEDEKISQSPNGSMMIEPSPITMAQPDFEQQKQLADMENGSMPGYKYGMAGYQYGMGGPSNQQGMTGTGGVSTLNTFDTPDANKSQAISQMMNPVAPQPEAQQPVQPVAPAPSLPVAPTVDPEAFDPRGAMEDFATGDNKYFKDSMSQAMNDVTETNRQNIMLGGAQMAANPNMTSGGQNSAISQMMSNANANRAGVVGDLGKAQLDKQYSATNTLMGDDIRQEQLTYDRTALGNEGWANANQSLKDVVAEIMTRPELRGKSDAEIELAIANDMGVQQILNQMKGFEADAGFTPSSNLLSNTIQSTLGANVDTANTNLGGFIDDSIVLGLSQEEIMGDPKILSEAARAAGFASAYDNGVVRPEVVELMNSMYETLDKSPTVQGAEAIVKQYPEIFEGKGYANMPEEQRNMVLDWVREQTQSQGMTVENGVLVWPEGSEGIVPWEDPDMMYGNFVTADGSAITYEGGQKMFVDSNGDKFAYDTLTYDRTDGDPVPAQVFDEVWDSLPDSMRLEMNKEGNISPDEIDKMMKYGVEYDISTPASEDNPNPYYDGEVLNTGADTIEDWRNFEDNGGLESALVFGDENAPNSDVPETLGHDNEKYSEWLNSEDGPTDILGNEDEYYFYTDETGEYKHMPRKSDEETRSMYYQASMKSDGSPLTSAEFASFLEGGEYVWDGKEFLPASVVTDNTNATKPKDLVDVQKDSFKDNPENVSSYLEANGYSTISVNHTGSKDGSRRGERSTFKQSWDTGDIITSEMDGGSVYEVVDKPSEYNYQAGVTKKYGQQIKVKNLSTGIEYYIYARSDGVVQYVEDK